MMENILTPILKKLETDDELISIKDPSSGLSLYPLVRHPLLFYLLFIRKKFVSVGEGQTASRFEVIRTLWFALIKNPFMLAFRRKEILIFNSGITNVLKGKRYFNRLADYFYSVSPEKTALVEETAYGKHALPRIHSDVYSNLFVRLLAKAMARIPFFAARGIETEFDRLFNAILQKLEGEELDHSYLQKLKVDSVARFKLIRAEYKVYQWLFRFVRPSVILVEDASYGSRAHLVRAAKEAGILVGEYQHGFINSLHLAYNYGPAVANSSDYKNNLPDIYLGFGRYWCELINLPAVRVSIGNPHLSESTKAISGNNNSNLILVIGGGAEPTYVIDLVLKLRQKYREGCTIWFRPHPLEWAKSDTIYGELIKEGVTIDKCPNIYESMAKASIIIGELSTAIYEAKSVTDNVYITRNQYSVTFGDESASLFPTLEDGLANDFDASAVKKVDSSFLWEADWRARYREFLLEHTAKQ